MKKIGYFIGRFQTPYLTEGQANALETFLNNKFDYYFIILGVPQTKASKNNPLDFDSRRRMIEDAYPKMFQFHYIKDENNDFVWSNNLDNIICKDIESFRSKDSFETYICGSKENVISKYFGKFETKCIENYKIDSLEFQKEMVSKKITDPASWRAGACWSANNRYPVAYHTVDCAIFDDLSFEKVWMAKKENEDRLRFIGGFVDPSDNSAEYAAKRETKEETGLDCSVLGYISSRKIDDWRYRNEADKIITSFYALIKQNGIPNANDDVKELYKVNILTLDEKNVMTEHHQLLKDAQNWVRTKQIFKEHKL